MNKIKMLIMDVDGTLTDGKIYISNSGEEMKAFNVKDGYAIKEILCKIGVTPVIITGRQSNIVKIRANELGINEVHQNVKDKVSIYNHIKERYNLNSDEIAFIGDDYNDLEMFSLCKINACPNDATEDIKDIANYVTKAKGGEGAVQEFILKIYKTLLKK